MNDDSVLILDGGLSTALADRGHTVGGALWTGELLLTNPDAVLEAHRDFVDAGADIIITGSYQVSFDGARQLGWDDADTEKALRNATTAARLAAAEGTLVAASVGPYGAFLADGSEFRGNYGVSDSVLRDFHARRLDILLETEPDLLAIETQPELAEIDVILSLLDERDSEIPFWVSCTVSEAGRIAGGAPWNDVVSRVAGSDSAIAIGINCSACDVLTPTLENSSDDLPFVIYPNLGQEWDGANEVWFGEVHNITDAEVQHWISLGARLIGGCCGFGSKDISRLREQV